MGSGRITPFKVHTAFDGGGSGPGDGSIDHAFRGNQACGRGQVTSAYGMCAHHFRQNTGAECVPGQNQQACCVAVEPVNGTVRGSLALFT